MCKVHRFLIFAVTTACLFILTAFPVTAQISVRTSDSMIVNNGDTITPIRFQGVHLISSPEYRTITITNNSSGTISNNSITIEADEDFTVNSPDSGLNL